MGMSAHCDLISQPFSGLIAFLLHQPHVSSEGVKCNSLPPTLVPAVRAGRDKPKDALDYRAWRLALETCSRALPHRSPASAVRPNRVWVNPALSKVTEPFPPGRPLDCARRLIVGTGLGGAAEDLSTPPWEPVSADCDFFLHFWVAQIQARQPAARDGQLGGLRLPWPDCVLARPSQPRRLRARIPQPLALCPPAGGRHGVPRALPAAPCSGWASGRAGPRNSSGLPRLRAPLALSAGGQLAQLLQCHGTGSTGSNAEVGGRRCPPARL